MIDRIDFSLFILMGFLFFIPVPVKIVILILDNLPISKKTEIQIRNLSKLDTNRFTATQMADSLGWSRNITIKCCDAAARQGAFIRYPAPAGLFEEPFYSLVEEDSKSSCIDKRCNKKAVKGSNFCDTCHF